MHTDAVPNRRSRQKANWECWLEWIYIQSSHLNEVIKNSDGLMGQTDKLAPRLRRLSLYFYIGLPFSRFRRSRRSFIPFLIPIGHREKSSVEAAAELLNRTGVAVRYDPYL